MIYIFICIYIYTYLHLYLHIHFILMITLACTYAFMYILHYHLIPRQRVPSAWSDFFSENLRLHCKVLYQESGEEMGWKHHEQFLWLLKWGPWISWNLWCVYIYILRKYIYIYIQNHRELFVCLLACLLVCWSCRCNCFLYLHVFFSCFIHRDTCGYIDTYYMLFTCFSYFCMFYLYSLCIHAYSILSLDFALCLTKYEDFALGISVLTEHICGATSSSTGSSNDKSNSLNF